MRRQVGLTIVASLLVIACGEEPDSTEAPPASSSSSSSSSSSVPSEPTPTVIELTGPPNVELLTANGTLELSPFTYCWTGPANDRGERESECADGIYPDPPPHAGTVGTTLRFRFPVAGWSFTAWLPDPDFVDGPFVDAALVEPGLYEIVLPEEAGLRVIQLSGRGALGDVHTMFDADVQLSDAAVPGE